MLTEGFKTRKSGKWLPLPFLVICFSLFLIFVQPGNAAADIAGPVFSQITPADGAAVNNSNVSISVRATDIDNVDMASVIVLIDGMKVNPILYFESLDESTEDETNLNIYYYTAYQQGTHSVNVSVKDSVGNISTTNWSFTVGQSVQILSVSPINGSTVSTASPVIIASVTSADTIDAGSVVMTLNNAPVNAVLNKDTGIISYMPPTALANEMFYNVALSFKDNKGASFSTTWQFYINTTQEMPSALDDATCLQCHDRTKHPMNNCAKCHGINLDDLNPQYPIDDCYNCHFNASYPPTYHTNGLPVISPPEHPVRITGSCVECHTKTWSTNIPQVHSEFDTAIRHTTTAAGCTNCHLSSLTREHQRRQDDQGNALTCFTCHDNPDPQIQNAIATQNTNCSACHNIGGGGHPEHNNGLDQYCQTCHSSTILAEPQFHAKNDCSICHQNTENPTVKYAISIKDTNCFACHTQGHNVNFVQKNPDDIPLYPGYQWSVPQPAVLWAGEAWLPAEFNVTGAKLMISNHRTDVTGPELFNWYTENLEAFGWQKASGPEQGSENFTLSFQKGNRMLNVNVYTGASHDTSAAYVGFRVELLYK